MVVCSSGPSSPEPQAWCFQCGAGYAAEVAACVECGVATVPEPPTEVADVGAADEDQLEYDLHEYSSQSRSMMASLLLGAAVPHAWQGAVLVVREADEEQVDGFVEAVHQAAAPALPEDAPRVGYALSDFDDDYVSRLTGALDAAGIAYGFDEDGDLEVAAADEARVEGLFDKLEGDDGEASTGEFGPGLDGTDAHDVLSLLFVASDRLQRNPRDRKGNRNLARGGEEIRQLALPFGFEARTWRAVLNQVNELVDIAGSDATQDEIAAAAAATRAVLRDLV
ncbi:MAG: hypothetical protein F4X37_03195 [Acidimicrobiia bacterium]|nr:hypothetical protein [bacterium]MXZ30717.1 hypothetical protein [Acidimicrobiia bacterium]MYB24109.1 hypothetical protein [Acidimicrobiia bacterium]